MPYQEIYCWRNTGCC